MILAIFISLALATPALAWLDAEENGSITLASGGTLVFEGIKLSPKIHIDYACPATDGTNYVMITASEEGTRAYGAQFDIQGVIQSVEFPVGGWAGIALPGGVFDWDSTTWPYLLGGGAIPTS